MFVRRKWTLLTNFNKGIASYYPRRNLSTPNEEKESDDYRRCEEEYERDRKLREDYIEPSQDV